MPQEDVESASLSSGFVEALVSAPVGLVGAFVAILLAQRAVELSKKTNDLEMLDKRAMIEHRCKEVYNDNVRPSEFFAKSLEEFFSALFFFWVAAAENIDKLVEYDSAGYPRIVVSDENKERFLLACRPAIDNVRSCTVGLERSMKDLHGSSFVGKYEDNLRAESVAKTNLFLPDPEDSLIGRRNWRLLFQVIKQRMSDEDNFLWGFLSGGGHRVFHEHIYEAVAFDGAYMKPTQGGVFDKEHYVTEMAAIAMGKCYAESFGWVVLRVEERKLTDPSLMDKDSLEREEIRLRDRWEKWERRFDPYYYYDGLDLDQSGFQDDETGSEISECYIDDSVLTDYEAQDSERNNIKKLSGMVNLGQDFIIQCDRLVPSNETVESELIRLAQGILLVLMRWMTPWSN